MGKPAPELAVAEWLSGTDSSIRNLKGSTIALDFWDSGNSDNIPSVRLLNVLHDIYEEKGLVCITIIPAREEVETVKQHIAEHSLRYSIGLDSQTGVTGAKGETFHRYAIGWGGSIVLINAAGEITGSVYPPDLGDQIQNLFATRLFKIIGLSGWASLDSGSGETVGTTRLSRIICLIILSFSLVFLSLSLWTIGCPLLDLRIKGNYGPTIQIPIRFKVFLCSPKQVAEILPQADTGTACEHPLQRNSGSGQILPNTYGLCVRARDKAHSTIVRVAKPSFSISFIPLLKFSRLRFG